MTHPILEFLRADKLRTQGAWNTHAGLYPYCIKGDIFAAKKGDNVREIPIVARCSYQNPAWINNKPLDSLEGRCRINEAVQYIEPNATFIAASSRIADPIKAFVRDYGEAVEALGLLVQSSCHCEPDVNFGCENCYARECLAIAETHRELLEAVREGM